MKKSIEILLNERLGLHKRRYEKHRKAKKQTCQVNNPPRRTGRFVYTNIENPFVKLVDEWILHFVQDDT